LSNEAIQAIPDYIVSEHAPVEQNVAQKRKLDEVTSVPVASVAQSPDYLHPGQVNATATISQVPFPQASIPQSVINQPMPMYPDSNPMGAYHNARNFSYGSQQNKPLTEQQKIERRERNREHAKRSRLRKKFLLESLQEQIHGLQSDIENLKNIVRRELPEKADSLLQEARMNTGQYTPLPTPSGFGPVKTLIEPDFRLMHALSSSQQNFAISDPSLPDNPIIYVSQGFLDLTGYTLDQVLGRNCRFLQGPGTDQSAVDVIRKGMKEGNDTSVCLLNYKADGTPFWNQFFIASLRDAEGNVVNYVGVQCEVSKAIVDSHISQTG